MWGLSGKESRRLARELRLAADDLELDQLVVKLTEDDDDDDDDLDFELGFEED